MQKLTNPLAGMMCTRQAFAAPDLHRGASAVTKGMNVVGDETGAIETGGHGAMTADDTTAGHVPSLN